MSGEIVTALEPRDVRRLEQLEARIETGLLRAADAAEALSEIRDSGLWRARHASFEDYCLIRWGIARNRLKSTLSYRPPPRLEQRDIFRSHEGQRPAEPQEDIGVLLERARAQGPDSVAELVRSCEETLLAEEARESALDEEERELSYLERGRSRLRQALKAFSHIEGTESVVEYLKRASEEAAKL